MVKIKPMKLFYKIIIICGATIISVFLLLATSITIYMTYKIPLNNYRLMLFQNDFRQNIKSLHPDQSELITEVAEVGNWADGTYCEFLVGQIRSSTLPKEELEKIYPYDFFTAGVHFFDGNEQFGSPWYELREKHLKDYKLKEGENVYLVWKSKTDYNTSGDIRCD